MTNSTQLRLTARPVGLPKTSDFTIDTAPVGDLADGDVLVKVLYISLDPAMRGWMSDAPSYLPPVGLGEVMRALGAGEVVESRDPRFKPGDAVSGLTGVRTFAKVPGVMLTRLDTALATLPQYLGVLGMTGLTAYFGLLNIGALKAGETVVVSGAAGAVGSVVGQIARIKGARAVGIAGGPDKCRWLVEDLGFDAAVDYREPGLGKRLREACPKRIDVFFDNVGGDILDAGLAQLNRHARVVICGAISQYNAVDGVAGPKNYLSLLVNRARMEGFLVFDFMDRYEAALAEMGGWFRDGRLKGREDVVDGGVEGYVDAFGRLFSGANTGKLVLKLA